MRHIDENNLNPRDLMLIRRGYIKLHKQYLDNSKLSSLTTDEKSRYMELGEIEIANERKKNITISVVLISIVILVLSWWGISAYQSAQENKKNEAIQKIEDAKPTAYNSAVDYIAATFPNKPSELRNNPDASSNPSVIAHHEVISGSNGSGLYLIDIVDFKLPFDEIDCMSFLGDTANYETNLQKLDVINLNDGRPTLNYIHKKESAEGLIYVRAAIFTTQNTNKCYRIGIADNPAVTEEEFNGFLKSVQISDPAQ